jgi:outer membrane lipoprotein-sorting protein
MMTLTLVAVASGAHAMTPMELVRAAMQVQGQVRDYTATVTVSIEAPNLQIPARTIKVYYKQPDKLHVESQGLVIIPRDALLMGNLASHLEDNTQASLVGTGTLNGRPVTCVKLTPLDAGPGTGRILLWIDTDRFLLVKTEVWDVAAKVMTITFTHTLAQERYWMPRSIVCDLSARMLDSAGETARATVTFANYRINTGLSDDIFEDEN